VSHLIHNLLCRGLGPDIVDHDGKTVPCAVERQLPADAAGRAGNQDDFGFVHVFPPEIQPYAAFHHVTESTSVDAESSLCPANSWRSVSRFLPTSSSVIEPSSKRPGRLPRFSAPAILKTR
jgi:hypothetical protein